MVATIADREGGRSNAPVTDPVQLALIDAVAATLVQTMMPVTPGMIAAGVAASAKVTTRLVRNRSGNGYTRIATDATTAQEFIAIWQAMLTAKLRDR